MRKVGTQYIMSSELQPVDIFPPNETGGRFGVVVNPWWMPKWLAWLLRNHLPIHLAWMNMPRKKKPYDDPNNERWWWIYPTGETHADAPMVRLKGSPLLWCEVEYVGPVKEWKTGKIIEWKEKGILRETEL